MRIALAALALAVAACGQGEPDVAARVVDKASGQQIGLTGRVVDQAGMIDDATETALINRLAALEVDTTDQLVVVTVPSLNGQPIEKMSLDLGNRWGIGRADVDNGVLLVVAPAERRVRIEVGTGLEGLLTDQKAAEIVQSILPEFRGGRMQQGILKGVGGIEAVLKSDKQRPQPKLEDHRKAA